MNVTLPEKEGIKKGQIILYVSIILVCIVCVIVAFYVQFYARMDLVSFIGLGSESTYGNKTEDETVTLESEFNNLFINGTNNDNGENNNKKQEQGKDLVYTGYQQKESKLNSYNLEVNIPHINVDNEITDGYNSEIENIFLTLANNVLQSENSNIIYTVDYVANVQDGILSLMIRASLKEGSNAQKVIIQTYNYDLRNNKEITLQEVLKIEKLDEQDVRNRINTKVQEEEQKAEDLQSLGYNIYSRDVNSNIYKLENSTEFYLTPDALYIIYAYGNETNTSEMDLVIL